MYLNYPDYISLSWTFGKPGCISSEFFKLKDLPKLFCISSLLEPGADCPKAVPFVLLERTSSHLPSRGCSQSRACTIHAPCIWGSGSQPLGKYVWKPEGVYVAQHITKQTAKGAQALINLNKYQQRITSERNLLFFWKNPSNLFQL